MLTIFGLSTSPELAGPRSAARRLKSRERALMAKEIAIIGVGKIAIDQHCR